MRAANGRPANLSIKWSSRARNELERTIRYIGSQDTGNAALVVTRLSKALELIAAQPAIGTLTNVRGVYRFPIPKTGHIIEYRVGPRHVTIVRWGRHTKKS